MEKTTDAAQLLPPAAVEAARRPLEESWSLPPEAYWDEAFYRAEIDTVFMRGWHFIGHEGRVPAPGALAAFDYAGVPILLVHGEDGKRRAFANTCRHRGAELVCGEAAAKRIVCPYHGWTYDLEGRLVSAPGMQEARDFRLEEHGLKQLRLEQLGGLMWMSFDEKAPPLARSLGDLPAKLAPYGLDDLVLTRRPEYDVACNWKIYVENFLDYYHTPIVHAKTLARSNLSAYHRQRPALEEGEGDYLILFGRHEGSAALLPGDSGFPPMPTLAGRAAEGSTYVCTFPCGLLGFTRDCVWYVEIRPTGPETCRIAVGSCFPTATAARPDFEEKAAAYYRRWDLTVEEDNRINEAQQRGLKSPFARAGRVSPFEPVTHAFRKKLLDALGL